MAFSMSKVHKPGGTTWVSGTHHVIYSFGFTMPQLGMKILNDITLGETQSPSKSFLYLLHPFK